MYFVIFSSSTAEGGADISSSGQTEAPLISSTANGPAVLHSFSLAPQQHQRNELVSHLCNSVYLLIVCVF